MRSVELPEHLLEQQCVRLCAPAICRGILEFGWSNPTDGSSIVGRRAKTCHSSAPPSEKRKRPRLIESRTLVRTVPCRTAHPHLTFSSHLRNDPFVMRTPLPLYRLRGSIADQRGLRFRRADIAGKLLDGRQATKGHRKSGLEGQNEYP